MDHAAPFAGMEQTPSRARHGSGVVRLGSLPRDSEQGLRFVQERMALFGKVTSVLGARVHRGAGHSRCSGGYLRTPLDTGLVQLLLNSGAHGAPPEATLICEVPASAGELVIPQALVEAYPPAGGIGLFQHSSYLSVFERTRITVDGGIVEYVVGRRQLVQPIH